MAECSLRPLTWIGNTEALKGATFGTWTVIGPAAVSGSGNARVMVQCAACGVCGTRDVVGLRRGAAGACLRCAIQRTPEPARKPPPLPEDDTARAWLIELRSDPRNVDLEVDRVTLLVREHARELGRCESRRRTRLRAARTAALRRIGGFSLNAVIAGLREEGLAGKAPRRTTASKWHGRGAAHILAAVSWRLRGGVFDPKERHRLEMLRSVFAASRADAGVPRPARRKAE